MKTNSGELNVVRYNYFCLISFIAKLNKSLSLNGSIATHTCRYI